MGIKTKTEIYQAEGWWYVRLIPGRGTPANLGPFQTRKIARSVHKDLKTVCQTTDRFVALNRIQYV